jgi:hypothetical protein
MLEAKTGRALLLEINPRMTSSSYLQPSGTPSLASLLYARLVGRNLSLSMPSETAPDTLVLFPQELERDPASPGLATAAHLVPWDEPELVAECIRLTLVRPWPSRLAAEVRSLQGRYDRWLGATRSN